MVRRPEDWPWSNYRATVGLEAAAPFLSTDWLLGAFGEERRCAVDGYRAFVAEGAVARCPWDELKQQVYLGSAAFVEQMQALINPDRPLQDVPRRQRRAIPIPLAEIAARHADRDRAMVVAYRTGDYSMQAIADYFGVGRMTVSRAVKRAERDSA